MAAPIIGTSRRRLLGGCGALAAASALPGVARAQDAASFPSRPITLVVPYAPGALNDTLTRALAQGLARRFGSPVVVVNRPGAGAQIGTQSVARAAPDGYTLVMGSNAPLVELPVLKTGVPYRTPDDFTFVARVSAGTPWLIISSTKFQPRTLPEVVAYAKANPGAVRYGSIGIGSGSHLAMALLEAETGTQFTHVPYQGAAPVVTDVLAGNIDIGLTGVGTMFAHRGSDRVRLLAVTVKDRNPYFPDVPTTVELGFPSVLAEVWFGIVGPAGIPTPIVEKLSQEINAALNDPEVQRILAAAGLASSWQNSPDFTRYAQDYIGSIQAFARTPAGRRMMEDMNR